MSMTLDPQVMGGRPALRCTGGLGLRRGVRPPNVHTHLGQHGTLSVVKVKAHGEILTDSV
jgi:hypothetical protein